MYTILVNDDNTLTTSIKERVMQRSKNANTLRFLVNQKYKIDDSVLNQIENVEEIESISIVNGAGIIDISDCTVIMEYILPISKKLKTIILTKSEQLYKEKLEYKLPFDTNLTSEPGDIQVQLTFIKVDLNEEGEGFQFVRKTSCTNIHITPIAAWSDIIPDEALDAIDQRIIKTDAQIKALMEASEVTRLEKADNIVLDGDTKELYLTADGEQIGDKVKLSDLGDEIIQSSSEGLITMMI